MKLKLLYKTILVKDCVRFDKSKRSNYIEGQEFVLSLAFGGQTRDKI